MKTLKLNKEDVLVCGKWRRLIRCTITIVMILALLEGGVMCPTVCGTGSPGLSWIKGP